ncbi:hypothetical protein EBR25_10430 [bacterium]|nr:hypothetical protein [bacterium]
MEVEKSVQNEIKQQRNTILKRQIATFVLLSLAVYGGTGELSAFLSTLLGGTAMTAILVLFTTVAQFLFEGITIQPPTEEGEQNAPAPSSDASPNQTQPVLEAEEVRSLEEGGDTSKDGEEPPEWGLTGRGALAILLIPLKFFILLIPLFVFRQFGKDGLAFFVVGLLLSVIPTFFRSSGNAPKG